MQFVHEQPSRWVRRVKSLFKGWFRDRTEETWRRLAISQSFDGEASDPHDMLSIAEFGRIGVGGAPAGAADRTTSLALMSWARCSLIRAANADGSSGR